MRLSISARWTLRYTIAMSVTLAVFAAVVYTQVAGRINREARLLTEVHAHELADSLTTQIQEHGVEIATEWLHARAERTVSHSERNLDLGIEYVDKSGSSILRAGSLARESAPLPMALIEGSRREVFRAVNLGGEHAHLLSIVPAPGGFLQVAIDSRRYAENIEYVRDVLLVALPIMLTITGLIGWLLASRSLAAISDITETARRISSQSLRTAIPTTGSGDELDQLASTLNEMIVRIRDGVDRMQRFNANAAHQLRTPLNRICAQIDATIQKPRSDEEYRQVLNELLERTHRLAAGVTGLLRLAGSEAGLDPALVQEVRIDKLLQTLLEFFEPLAEEHGTQLSLVCVQPLIVPGDPSWLRQLFSNLIDNAIKYCSAGDEIVIDTWIDADCLVVEVRDSGPGIAPEELNQVFDRFERGQADRNKPGFGLGLPIAREIARAHSGDVEIDGQPGSGTCVRVRLPRRT